MVLTELNRGEHDFGIDTKIENSKPPNKQNKNYHARCNWSNVRSNRSIIDSNSNGTKWTDQIKTIKTPKEEEEKGGTKSRTAIKKKWAYDHLLLNMYTTCASGGGNFTCTATQSHLKQQLWKKNANKHTQLGYTTQPNAWKKIWIFGTKTNQKKNLNGKSKEKIKWR